MTRLLFFPLFILFLTFSVRAQNLIPDPGFEIHNDDCAPYPGLTHWHNPNLATPDTQCYPSEPCNPLLTEATIEVQQLLHPFEGNCVAGLFVAEPPLANMQSRDYLTTELLEPLSSGSEYLISCRLYRHIIFDAAIDKIGFYFSEEQPFYETPEMLPVEPQIELDTLITTTDEWVFVSRSYIAQGGERFMTFGNFRGPDEMTYELMGLSWKKFKHSYYFFDDMRLTSRETSVTEKQDKHQFNWNGQMLTGKIHEKTVCQIYDTRGRLIVTEQLAPGYAQLTLNALSPGVYIAMLVSGKQHSSLKLWKE